MRFSGPKQFLYFDSEGIRTIYAQSVPRLETSHQSTTSNKRAGRATGGLQSGGALAVLGNLVGLKAEMTGELSSNSIESTSTTIEPVQMFRELLDLFADKVGEPSFQDLSDAAAYLTEHSGQALVLIESKFDAPQFYSGSGHDSVNQERHLVFVHDPKHDKHYNDDDRYFKKAQVPVVMSAGIDKLSGCKNGMTGTSHLAVALRGFSGRDLLLNVFGSCWKLNDSYQIKPYAIWF